MKKNNSIVGDGRELYEKLKSEMKDDKKIMEFLSDCYIKTNDKVFRRAMMYFSDVVMEGMGTDDIDEYDDEVTDDSIDEMMGKSFSVRKRADRRHETIKESYERMKKLSGLI